MLQMLVVTLREGIEAFLIVAIAITYLRKTGRDGLVPAAWWGTAIAVTLFYGGKPVDLSRYTRQNVARLRLP